VPRFLNFGGLHNRVKTVGKTAVITGGAGGLGRALATALQDDGWFTALVDISVQDIENGARQHGYQCDLTDAAQTRGVCAQICADYPSIDLVIYNAGVTHITTFAESDMAAHRKVFEINYFAAVACAQAFLQSLRASKGIHLAISSVAGFSPLLWRTSYAASKHALEGFFKSLRSEERKFGVRTVIAAPSFVATNIGNEGRDASGLARPGSAKDGVDYMSAQEAAVVILNGLHRRRDFIPVGRVAWLSWVINRLSPWIFQRLMERKINRE